MAGVEGDSFEYEIYETIEDQGLAKDLNLQKNGVEVWLNTRVSRTGVKEIELGNQKKNSISTLKRSNDRQMFNRNKFLPDRLPPSEQALVSFGRQYSIKKKLLIFTKAYKRS